MEASETPIARHKLLTDRGADPRVSNQAGQGLQALGSPGGDEPWVMFSLFSLLHLASFTGPSKLTEC